MAAIKDLGIRDIYYTTNDGYVYERVEKHDMGGVAQQLVNIAEELAGVIHDVRITYYLKQLTTVLPVVKEFVKEKNILKTQMASVVTMIVFMV